MGFPIPGVSGTILCIFERLYPRDPNDCGAAAAADDDASAPSAPRCFIDFLPER